MHLINICVLKSLLVPCQIDSAFYLPQQFITASVPTIADEFVDMGGSDASSLLSSAVSSASVAADTDGKAIPVVDFSLLINGTPNQRSEIIRVIGQACEEWGCFSLVNHGVPESLRTSMAEVFGEFFDLPVEERREFIGNKVFDPIRHEQGLNTTTEGQKHLREFVRIFAHPSLHCPTKPLHFRSLCEEYARQTREIAIKLLGVIGESLGLEESYMEKTLDLANGHQLLVGNRYPPLEQQEIAVGLPSHSDTPLLTLLMQVGNTDGLQVFHDNEWVPVHLIPDSLFVHTGDLLEIVSNGRYQSLLHRVILNNKSTRKTVITALGSPTESMISPAPKLVEIANNVSAFRSMKYIEYVEISKGNQFGKSGLALIKT